VFHTHLLLHADAAGPYDTAGIRDSVSKIFELPLNKFLLKNSSFYSVAEFYNLD
jgi:hypothetical protein